MVKGKGSPMLMAQQAANRKAGSRAQRRAAEAVEKKERYKHFRGIGYTEPLEQWRNSFKDDQK